MNIEPLSREQIFNRAAEIQDPDLQRQLLDDLCGGDVHLRAEIEDLLSQDDKLGDFLEPPNENGTGLPDDTYTDAPEETISRSSIGSYELKKIIGRGGMGVVYEARHLKQGNRVALKTLPTGGEGRQINADKLHRFRKEFRSLTEINHPNLVGMQTLEVDGSQWFFTMDLIEGEDFLSYVRPGDQLDEDRLRSAIKQLAGGIIFLHEQGIIHRDLKPSNVMVEPDGRLLILDFGLVAQLQSDFGLVAQLQTNTDLTVSRSGMFAGTPRYAAPEQMFGERSEASDWYAFGTMLYESLTGQTPFVGKPLELLRQKQTEDPPSLVEKGPTKAALDLAILADGLLKRESSERFNTTHVINSLHLGLDTRTCGLTAGSNDSNGSVNEEQPGPLTLDDEEIVLIGREEQLAQMESAKREFLEKREPMVVWVMGKSGEGKSSLAENFLRPIRRGTEMLVLSGRCYDRESVPFKVIDSQIDPLVRFLRSRSDADVEDLLPPGIEMLGHLFPVMRRVNSIAKRGTKRISVFDDEQIRNLAFAAFKELLVAISRQTPVVMFVDDLQWGDADSAEVLAELLAPPDPPGILLIGSFRSDEMKNSPFLNEWDECIGQDDLLQPQRVLVEPLTEQQCLEFICQRFGERGKSLKNNVTALIVNSKGNPYFLEHLLEGYDSQTGEFQPVPLAELIAKRVGKCPDGAEDLLNAIAIAGKAVSITEAADVVGKTTSALATLTHMRSERLVRMIGWQDDQLIDTYHDKIRESVLEGLSDRTRHTLHLKYGEMIEQNEKETADCVLAPPSSMSANSKRDGSVSARIFDLAYHFFEATSDKAFGYQILAGEVAARAYALEDAREHLRKAEKLLPVDSSPETQYHLWVSLGSIDLKLKDSKTDSVYFQRAIDVAKSRHDRAKARIGLGTMHQFLGEFSKATATYDQALSDLGRRRPKSTLGCLISSCISIIRVFLIPKVVQNTRSLTARPRAELEFEIGSCFTWYLFEQNAMQSLRETMRMGVVANRADRLELMVLAYEQMGMTFAMLGVSFLTKICRRRSDKLVAILQDFETTGIAYGFAGGSSYLTGNLGYAETIIQKGIEMLQECGGHHNQVLYFHNLRHLHSVYSSATVEIATAEMELDVATSYRDARAICWGNYALAFALARNGRLRDSMCFIEKALTGIAGDEKRNCTETICRGHHGFVLMQASDYVGARLALERSWSIAQSNLLYNDYAVHSFQLLLQSVAGPNWIESSDVDVSSLRKLCRRASVFHWMYPLQRPGIDRTRGRALWAIGRRKAAIRYMERSIRIARRMQMGWDLARALLDLAAVKEDGRDQNRREAIELLKEMESVIPSAESWLLGDQYDNAVVATEFDLEDWERESGSVTPKLK